MLSYLSALKRKLFKRSIKTTIHCWMAACIFTPGFFIFQIQVMRPLIIDILKMKPEIQCFHIVLSTYCFINVVGNMLLSIFTDNTIREYHGEGVYCKECKKNQPPKSWHCRECGVCVLTRDHHCGVLSHCVGLNNRRYFVCLLLHLTTSLFYASYYNYFVVAVMVKSMGFVVATLRILNPIMRHATIDPMGMRELLITIWYANLILLFFIAGLLCYHVRNILKGLTAYENKMKMSAKANWRDNINSVLGVKWHWAILWPFIESPLPVKGQLDVTS